MRSPTIFEARNPSGKKVWKVDVHIGEKPNGAPKTTRRTAATKKAATELGWALYRKALSGEMAQDGRELFHSYADRWLEQVKGPEVRPSTKEDYRYKLEHYIIPVFGQRRLSAISSTHISEWLASLKSDGKSNFTIKGIRQVINAVLRNAQENGLILRNPVTLAPRYRTMRRDAVLVKEPWSASEARSALEAAKGTPLELFAVLLLHSALRKSELVGLKWSDFNFEDMTFTINRSIREGKITGPDGKTKTGLREDDPKTPASHRTLLITQPIIDAIMRARELERDTGVEGINDWVFKSRKGTLSFPSSLQNRLRKLLDAHGVRRIRTHDIRHTALVLAIQQGTPMEAVSQGAGHSRLDTTKSIYAPYVQTLSDQFSRGVTKALNPHSLDRDLQDLVDGTPRTPSRPSTGSGSEHGDH